MTSAITTSIYALFLCHTLCLPRSLPLFISLSSFRLSPPLAPSLSTSPPSRSLSLTFWLIDLYFNLKQHHYLLRWQHNPHHLVLYTFRSCHPRLLFTTSVRSLLACRNSHYFGKGCFSSVLLSILLRIQIKKSSEKGSRQEPSSVRYTQEILVTSNDRH